MPRVRRTLAVAVLCCLRASTLAAQSTAQSGDVASLVAGLDRMFGAVDSTTTPGCVVGARRAGQVVIRSYGLADMEHRIPNDSLTVFEAGSVSKQVTAAVVLLLAQSGRISLDDDVRRWIPELSKELPRFTIRELLTHETGLRDWGDIIELTGWPRGTREYAMRDMISLIARQRAPNFPAGTEYSYSNSNYLLAAEIVARAVGESFDAYSQRVLFKPLGMVHTRWRDQFRTVVAKRAAAWTPDDSGHWQLDMPFEDLVGAGGLLTTVPDMLRWNANFDAPVVGGPNFAREMERAGVLRSGRTTSYTLGLELDSLGGERTVSHAGATAGYRAFAGRVPARAADVALLCNAGSLNTESMGPSLLALVGGLPVPAAESRPELGAAAADFARTRLAGMYRSRRTRQPVQVRSFVDGVSVNTWVGYRARGAEFVSLDGRRTLSFEGPATKPAARYRVATIDGDMVVYDRVEAWSPSRAELMALAGRYDSDDAESSWRLFVRNDSLRVEVRRGVEYPLVPRYRDAFAVSDQGWLVTFRRDARGRVTGLDVGSSRMRTMPFARR